ncbi:hypothetical protein DFJ73DRAFT_870494 [Zopfochytrium polystomum]|nr:hypothetical protein DFJ73DRAFT_870494 [Zopfochytrium polystomum]
MSEPIDLHVIFYGNHSQDTQRIVSNFVRGLNSSSWWTVARTYWGSTGNVTSDMALVGTYHDDYSLGTSLEFGGAWTVATNAAQAMGWPDPTSFETFARSPLYIVLLANDVQENGPGGTNCEDYCGYHSGRVMAVTDATRCPGTLPSTDGVFKGSPGCMPRYWRNQTDPAYSINRNQHADSMVGIIAHEIIETASNWDQAWTDPEGLECADKCETQYLDVKGIGSTSPYNDAYNVEFGGNRYLIQSLWSATSQTCLLAQG